MTKGLYKLDAAEHTIDEWRKLVIVVATRTRTSGRFGEAESLGPGMAFERGTYLKGLPARLTEIIGYNILPAIAALTGDGVPKAEVQRRLSQAESDAKRLIADCEAVRLLLKPGIKHEYDAMRGGGSHVTPLLDDAESRIRKALRACDG